MVPMGMMTLMSSWRLTKMMTEGGADEDNILSDLKEFYAEEGDTGDNISDGWPLF